MLRRLTLLSIAVVMIGLVAAPAAADEATEVTDGPFSFDAINPCTGEVHTVTLTIFASIHDHEDEFTARESRTGTTSDGYVMDNGRGLFKDDGTTLSFAFRDPWHNTDNGSEFEAAGRVIVEDGEVVVDDFRLKCLTSPTILP